MKTTAYFQLYKTNTSINSKRQQKPQRHNTSQADRLILMLLPAALSGRARVGFDSASLTKIELKKMQTHKNKKVEESVLVETSELRNQLKRIFDIVMKV
jgi:hypothetical protein